MTQPSTPHTDDRVAFRGDLWLFPLLSLVAAGVAILLLGQPILVAAILIGCVLVSATFRKSAVVTYGILFLVYTNSLVVAVKFHGLPAIFAKLAPLLLLIPLFDRVVIKKRPLVFGPSLPWMVLFLGVQILGALGALHPGTALEHVQTYLFEGLLLYLLITNLINTRAELRVATWALLLAGVVLAVPPFVQHACGAFGSDFGGFAQLEERPDDAELPGAEWEGTIRHAGSIGEKNRYAQALLMLVPLGFCRFLGERPFAWRAAGALVAAFALTGAALAFSRGAAVAFALVVVAAAALGCLSRKQTCVIVVALVLGALANPEYRARLASLADLKKLASQGGQSYADGALKGRATEMAAAALAFRDHPVVGVGPGMFRHHAQEYGQLIGIRALDRERQSHSLLLDVAAENGILGLICIVAIFWQLTRRLCNTRTSLQATDPDGVQLVNGYLLAMITYFATGLFLHFAYIRYFWLMLALTDSAGALSKDRREPRLNSA